MLTTVVVGNTPGFRLHMNHLLPPHPHPFKFYPSDMFSFILPAQGSQSVFIANTGVFSLWSPFSEVSGPEVPCPKTCWVNGRAVGTQESWRVLWLDHKTSSSYYNFSAKCCLQLQVHRNHACMWRQNWPSRTEVILLLSWLPTAHNYSGIQNIGNYTMIHLYPYRKSSISIVFWLNFCSVETSKGSPTVHNPQECT